MFLLLILARIIVSVNLVSGELLCLWIIQFPHSTINTHCQLAQINLLSHRTSQHQQTLSNINIHHSFEGNSRRFYFKWKRCECFSMVAGESINICWRKNKDIRHRNSFDEKSCEPIVTWKRKLRFQKEFCCKNISKKWRIRLDNIFSSSWLYQLSCFWKVSKVWTFKFFSTILS